MSNATWTVEGIKELLGKSNKAVERAVLCIYERQTADEKAVGETNHQNGVGFNASDAELLTSFAAQINKKVANGGALGNCLSPKQLELARKKMPRYARQLAEEANGKAQPAKPEATPAGGDLEEQIYRAEAAQGHISEVRNRIAAFINS